MIQGFQRQRTSVKTPTLWWFPPPHRWAQAGWLLSPGRVTCPADTSLPAFHLSARPSRGTESVCPLTARAGVAACRAPAPSLGPGPGRWPFSADARPSLPFLALLPCCTWSQCGRHSSACLSSRACWVSSCVPHSGGAAPCACPLSPASRQHGGVSGVSVPFSGLDSPG